jgi:hypothetical protein
MAAKPVVAGTDGSEESLRAVDWAAREAVLRGLPLRIVSAAALLPRMAERQRQAVSGLDTVSDTLRRNRDRGLAAAAERAAAAAADLLIDVDELDGAPAAVASWTPAVPCRAGRPGSGQFTPCQVYLAQLRDRPGWLDPARPSSCVARERPRVARAAL